MRMLPITAPVAIALCTCAPLLGCEQADPDTQQQNRSVSEQPEPLSPKTKRALDQWVSIEKERSLGNEHSVMRLRFLERDIGGLYERKCLVYINKAVQDTSLICDDAIPYFGDMDAE